MAYKSRKFPAYQAANKRLLSRQSWTRVIIFVSATILYTAFLYRNGGARSYLDTVSNGASTAFSTMNAMRASNRKLSVSTWNVAAINNNPFEYWITMKNPGYEELMVNVEKFIDTPGNLDVPVNDVFTQEMFERLDSRLVKLGWTSMRSFWENDFRSRKIVSQFLKDPLLGSKRLASMPDRVTNTINLANRKQPVCRPTVINMYEGDLDTMDMWYDAWENFMFVEALSVETSEGVKDIIPYQMLLPIKQSKYPDITQDEESVSLPLQTMCGAIFDAILVHMMNTVSTPDVWQPLKRQMVDSLNKKKVANTLQILESVYGSSDIITLQEVSAAFVAEARERELGKLFHIVTPLSMDMVRDQNSVILLNRYTFPDGAVTEISELVESSFPEGVNVPVAQGDILAISTADSDGIPFVVASFHGDTNGLATIPVLDAIISAIKSEPKLSKHHLIFGLDANTYEIGINGKKQDVLEFGAHYNKYDLTSCWGDMPDPKNYTTYNARTYLQPQLNKACKSTEKRSKGDVNPKDFILFSKQDFNVVKTWKDNTGEKEYIEDMAFPTLKFPSDHGILSTVISPKVPE